MAGNITLSYSTSSSTATSIKVTWTMYYYGNGVSYNNDSDMYQYITFNGSSTSTVHTKFSTSTSAQTMCSGNWIVTRTHSTQKLTATGTMYTAISLGTLTASSSISIDPKTSYTVSYNANGGSGAPGAQTKWYGETLTLSSSKPTRTGYQFLGWSTSSTATSATWSAGGSYTTNSKNTLYAVWKANTYTVRYNGNESTSGSTANSTHTYNIPKNLTANGFTRTYYNFGGWATSQTGAAVYSDQQSVTNLTSTNGATVDLYAVWVSAYTPPKINDINIIRGDSDGQKDITSNNVRLSFNWLAGNNTGTISNNMCYKLEGAWDSEGEVQLSGSGGEVVLNKNYDLEENGLVTLSLIDKANNNETTVVTFNIPEGGYILHVNDKGTAVNFFGTVKEEMDGVYAPSMTEAELNTFLDSLNRNFRGSVDWVVEEGTSGIWTYRKWDSGIAECWGMAEISGLSWSSYTTGGIATNYNSSPAQIPMPTSFFTSIESINANTHYAGSNVGWVANTSFGSGNVLLTFIRNGTTGVMRAFINVKGRWK